MRKSYAVVLLVLASAWIAGSQPAEAQENSIDPSVVRDRFAESDRAILELVLSDFASQDESWVPKRRAETEVVLVHSETLKTNGMLSDSQAGVELRDKEIDGLPEFLGQVRERNAGAVKLPAFPMEEHGLVSLNLDEAISKRFLRFGKLKEVHPQAFAFVQLWLPGYDAEGDRALVRFHFGPTSHGATATYFVVKRGEAWAIEWRNFSYYL